MTFPDPIVIDTAGTLVVPVDSVYGPAWHQLPPLEDLLGPADSGIVTREPQTGAARPPDPTPSGNLVTAGTLFRGISLVGNQGANLTGGLDLRVQGQISKGTFLSGHLTDQNLPIQPEGNTRTLNELDRVRLNLRGDWGSLEAGDFVLHSDGGSLSTFDRKLEGMQAQVHPGNLSIKAALAGTQGRFRHQSLMGQDGRQGPYHLTTKDGSRLLIVLAGSEKVWLNGQRLERGENLDYAIDYSTGELTFMPRHTIRSDSRLEVDFEYTDLVYHRTTGFAAARWGSDSNNITVTALRERDNPESNLEFSLSSDDQERLRLQGDTPGGTWVSTAGLDSAGNYDLVAGHYAWAGVGAGTHSVSFHNVGENGEYRRIAGVSRIIYAWVPVAERDLYQTVYAPQRLLKPPEQHEFVGVNLQLEGAGIRPRTQLEVGLSRTDLNKFSPLDDGDNSDFGVAAGIGWQTSPVQVLRRPWILGAQIDMLRKGGNFRAPGRFTTVEFQRDWDLSGSPQSYQWETVELDAINAQGTRLFAELGYLAADTSGTRRQRWGLEKAVWGPASGAFQQTLLNREDDSRYWRRSVGSLKYNFKNLQPTLAFELERRALNDTSAYNVEQIGAGLLAQINPATSVGLYREFRREIYDAGPSENARLWRLNLSRRWAGGTQLESGVSFNEKTFSDDRQDLSYFMGDFSLIHRRRGQPWWFDLRYRLDRSVAEAKVVAYDSMATGQGHYRYDPVYDMYVPDETGTFRRYILPSGVLQPVSSVNVRLRTQVELNKLKLPVDWLQGLHEARLNLHGRVALQARKHELSGYRFPSRADTAIVRYESTFRLDFAFQQARGSPHYNLLFTRQNRVSREALPVTPSTGAWGEVRRQFTLDLGRTSRITSGPFPMNLEGHLETGRDITQSSVNPQRDHEIVKGKIQGTLAVTLLEQITVTLNGRRLQEVDHRLDDLTVNLRSMGAGLQKRLGRRGRVRAEIEWINVTAPGETALPFIMAEGFPRGWSTQVRASGQVYFSQNLLLSISALSRRAAGGVPFSSLNLEIRSRF